MDTSPRGSAGQFEALSVRPASQGGEASRAAGSYGWPTPPPARQRPYAEPPHNTQNPHNPRQANVFAGHATRRGRAAVLRRIPHNPRTITRHAPGPLDGAPSWGATPPLRGGLPAHLGRPRPQTAGSNIAGILRDSARTTTARRATR